MEDVDPRILADIEELSQKVLDGTASTAQREQLERLIGANSLLDAEDELDRAGYSTTARFLRS